MVTKPGPPLTDIRVDETGSKVEVCRLSMVEVMGEGLVLRDHSEHVLLVSV